MRTRRAARVISNKHTSTLTQQPSRHFTSAVRTFGNGFVKRHDKSLVCVVVDAVVVLYQQELAGASGGQILNALQEITLGR